MQERMGWPDGCKGLTFHNSQFPPPGQDKDGWGEPEVQQWGRGAVEGCGNHRPFHHPDTETMATVPKVTGGAERGEASLGGRKLREDGMQRENPRERATQIKAEPERPGWRWGEGAGEREEGKQREGDSGEGSERDDPRVVEKQMGLQTWRGDRSSSPGNDSDRQGREREGQCRQSINPPPTQPTSQQAPTQGP